jgi:hypothetical protein
MPGIIQQRMNNVLLNTIAYQLINAVVAESI